MTSFASKVAVALDDRSLPNKTKHMDVANTCFSKERRLIQENQRYEDDPADLLPRGQDRDPRQRAMASNADEQRRSRGRR